MGVEIVSNDSLLALLEVFREARLSLVSRTSSEDPDLFKNFFEFEGNIEILKLVIEKECMLWIDKHFEIFDTKDILKSEYSNVDKFKESMLTLLEYQAEKGKAQNNLAKKDFYLSLISEKNRILNELIQISDVNEQSYQRLVYSYQRDKALFDREFRKLAEDKS
jgi:hypothetical protein